MTDGEAAAVLGAGPLEVLRRGLQVTPELREGLAATVALAVAGALGKLAVPVLVQQALDRGAIGPGGLRPDIVYPACAATAALVVALYVVSRATYLRLVLASERSLLGLRARTFDHVHRLSLGQHEEQRRGALVARVTSDVETLAQFLEWGAVAWVVDSSLIAATIGLMTFYEWRLALVTVVAFVPVVVVFPIAQRRQLVAQDRVRDAVAETLADVSEAVVGAPVVRAYGLEGLMRRRLHATVARQYRAHMVAARYIAGLYPLGDLFGAVALAGVVAVGASAGPGWGVSLGEMLATLFLVGLLLNPLSELSELVDQTQMALAGWRKVLAVLATPVEVPEPQPGTELPSGPLAVDATGVAFAYRGGPQVLDDVTVRVPAGATVAVVGRTGSGKSTFARLLCRLADPDEGAVHVGGVDLQQVAPESRRRAIRLVPQEGFLLDGTVADNVRAARPAASDDDVAGAFARLGLLPWLDRLPDGLDTLVGERGAQLSAGERQLVALARAHLGDPGLLVLDEATSAVDGETERVLARAIGRAAEGRTVVTISHRLDAAAHADLVVVFDAGRVVEHGRHEALVAAGGPYADLYAAWQRGAS